MTPTSDGLSRHQHRELTLRFARTSGLREEQAVSETDTLDHPHQLHQRQFRYKGSP
ncbi:MAG: hypothetical protein PVI09_16625 [Anaerolineae bacterium]